MDRWGRCRWGRCRCKGGQVARVCRKRLEECTQDGAVVPTGKYRQVQEIIPSREK